jgi:hypothetical protein
LEPFDRVTASRSGTTAGERPDPWSRLVFGLALAVGLVRFWRLGEWSLWIDEALTLSDSLHGEDQKNPLGYWLFHLVLSSWSGRPDEVALRLVPAVLGWLSIPLCWWAFKPLAGPRAAAGAALLVALSAWHVYWSQTARFYTLVLDLSLVGSALFARGLWWDSPWRIVAGFLVALSAGLAHPGAVSLLPALIVAPAVLHYTGRPVPVLSRRCRVLLQVTSAVALLVAAPWVRDIWRAWQDRFHAGTPSHFVLTVGWFFTPALGAGALFGGVLAWRRRSTFDCLALALCALTLGGWVAVAVFARASAQYVFFLLPWVAVLAASPLSAGHPEQPTTELASSPTGLARRLQWGYLALLALPLAAETALYFGKGYGGRPRWREAYAYVWSQRGPDDVVLGMDAPAGEYYLAPERTNVRHPRLVTYLNDQQPRWLELWTQRDKRTWFVVNYDRLDDWPRRMRAEFERLLREDCRLVKRFPVGTVGRDLSLYVFVRD